MKRRVVIADAGPLIALARIDALGLLSAMFEQIYITATVRHEILPPESSYPEKDLLVRTLDEGWIEVVSDPIEVWHPLNPGIDAGESSAIHLACSWRDLGLSVLLIMDDRAGRLEAQSRRLSMIGTAAVIGLAKTAGLIPAARPLLERLTQSGYFIGPSVIAAILADVGESPSTTATDAPDA